MHVVSSYRISRLYDKIIKYVVNRIAGARFTKCLTTILRLSYDNAKVTIDLMTDV